MTSPLDLAQALSAPVELIQIVIGATTYRYTSADEAQEYLGASFSPAPIVRRARDMGGTAETSGTLELEVPLDHALASAIRTGDPSGPMPVTLYARQRGDDAAITTFLGDVVRGAPDGQAFVIGCRSLEAQLAIKIPRVLIQRACSNMLYDIRCQADPASFSYEGEITAISDRVITVEGAADEADTDADYFLNGLVLLDGSVMAVIESVDGDALTLLEASPGLTVGATVTLRAGCDRTLATCRARFDNVRHFNGDIAIPSSNPFAPSSTGLG